MPFGKKLIVLLFVFGFLPGIVSAQFYYGLHQTFGKNRVQYNDFDWTYMRYEQYDVYFYKGGRPFAEKTSVMAKRNLAQMQRFLDQNLDQRIYIMVFNSLSDLKQSNLNAADEEAYNTGGVTRNAGNRMFVYYDGDYAHLEQQIREGLAHLILSNMLYGGFTSALKNSALLSLPEWYTEGLISYMSRPWDPTIDEHVMDGFASGTYKRLNSLLGEEAVYCGHGIWNYIAETYGEGVIKNILFMTIIHRSVDKALQQVLGITLKEFQVSLRDFYTKRYQNTLAQENLEGSEIIRAKKEERIFEVKVSENGRYLAYASNQGGLYKAYTYDFVKKKKSRVFKRGFRIAQNNDYSYPLLAWSPNNRILAAITEEKGFIWLYFYDEQKKKLERKELFGFQKILSFRYSDDGKELLFSAVKNGRTDIFVYAILSTSIDQITNDDFTDLYPDYLNNGKQIVFSSNRIHDTLSDNQKAWRFNPNMDLFVYNRTKKDNKLLWRLSNTPAESEIRAQRYQPGYISFLSNPNGKQERFIIGIDSSIAFVDTITHYAYSFTRGAASDLSRNITEEYFSPDGDRGAGLYFIKKRFRIYDIPYKDATEMSLTEADDRKENQVVDNNRKNILTEVIDEVDPRASDLNLYEIDINNYEFDPSLVRQEGPKLEPVKPSGPVTTNPTQQQTEEENYVFPPARNYFLTFFRDNFTFKIDFVFDNPQYQTFTGIPNGDLLNAGFNAQFKVGTTDLLNNYRIVGGFRTDFQPVPGLGLSPNSEVMLGLVNQKKRLNKQLTLYRRSQLTTQQGFFWLRLITYEGHLKAIWPFNPVQSIQGSVGWRHTREIVLSDGPISLPISDRYLDYGVVKAAFIHDNTRMLGMNLYRGTRYKIFSEYYQNATQARTYMGTAGIDFRNYVPIHRTFIVATRFAAGTSFGSEKLIHYLGGVDNTINPKINTETPISRTENYQFQTVVTNMRGFWQNARNGNSFAVLNGELRFPIFNYLANQPIRSEFINNFQIVGFGDLGTAWNGPSPWSDENAFNNRIITSGNLTITINRQTNPLIGGYGFGLRSRVLGYFVRADWAWGVENGIVLPSVFYFSLSTDF
jgi:Tol biopolymer transport system component